jgi:hypothetical protein
MLANQAGADGSNACVDEVPWAALQRPHPGYAAKNSSPGPFRPRISSILHAGVQVVQVSVLTICILSIAGEVRKQKQVKQVEQV